MAKPLWSFGHFECNRVKARSPWLYELPVSGMLNPLSLPPFAALKLGTRPLIAEEQTDCFTPGPNEAETWISQRQSQICYIAGWMTCEFMSFSTVFQSYQDNERLIMEGCV